MDVVLVKSSVSFKNVDTSLFDTEAGKAPVRKTLAKELDVKESQVEIIDVTSTTTRRRLVTQTIVEYQVVVDSEDYAQLDATTAKIESGLAPSAFKTASDQLANAVVIPSRSDSIETAAGVPSLTFAALQSDNANALGSLSSSQTYEGPQLMIDSGDSDESTAPVSTAVGGGGGSSAGVIAGVVIGVVVVAALVAAIYSKRQTSSSGSADPSFHESHLAETNSRRESELDDRASTAAVI
jgi:hypothetical protein